MTALIINNIDHMQNATQQISFTQLNYWFSLFKNFNPKLSWTPTNLNNPSGKKETKLGLRVQIIYSSAISKALNSYE